MYHPDRRHHTRDRIIAVQVMKLEVRQSRLRAAREEPGPLETRKVRPTAA